jgi:hypothetical protein
MALTDFASPRAHGGDSLIVFSGVTRRVVQRGRKATWRMLASRAAPGSRSPTRFPADSSNGGWCPSSFEQAIPLALQAGITRS